MKRQEKRERFDAREWGGVCSHEAKRVRKRVVQILAGWRLNVPRRDANTHLSTTASERER